MRIISVESMMAAHLELAKDYHTPVPAGKPFSVPLPGSQIPGRSAVYRHWRFKDGLLKSLDPNVGASFGK